MDRDRPVQMRESNRLHRGYPTWKPKYTYSSDNLQPFQKAREDLQIMMIPGCLCILLCLPHNPWPNQQTVPHHGRRRHLHSLSAPLPHTPIHSRSLASPRRLPNPPQLDTSPLPSPLIPLAPTDHCEPPEGKGERGYVMT